METFTVEKIRAAFWRTFRESEEAWYDYLRNCAQSDASVEEYWNAFLQNLTENHNTICGICGHPDCKHNASGQCEATIEALVGPIRCYCRNQRLATEAI